MSRRDLSDARPGIRRIKTDVPVRRRRRQARRRGARDRAAQRQPGYGDKQALFDISMDIAAKQVTAFIGPSGCGKSTLLRCLNRMNDLIDGVTHHRDDPACTGRTSTPAQTDVIEVRRRIGMVFQKSNPLPKSIYENVVYGLRIAGIRDKATLDEACERACGRGAVGRGQGSAARERPVPVRRPAAAAVHRARDRHRAGDHPDGRALLGARPDRDPARSRS